MYCTKCGQENSDSSNFCLNCGKGLPAYIPVESTNNNTKNELIRNLRMNWNKQPVTVILCFLGGVIGVIILAKEIGGSIMAVFPVLAIGSLFFFIFIKKKKLIK